MKNILNENNLDILSEIRAVLEGSATREINPKALDSDLDGVPNADHEEKHHETAEHPLAPEASNLDPNVIARQIKEQIKLKEHPFSHGGRNDQEVTSFHGKAEKDADYMKQAENYISGEEGDIQEKYVSGEPSMLKPDDKSQEITIVGAEHSHLDPKDAMIKMREQLEVLPEDDEEDSESSEEGQRATGKVANLDGVARESVELVYEDWDQNLDQQDAERLNRDRRPKWANLVREKGFDVSGIPVNGMRLNLSFANGQSTLLPKVSEPSFSDLAEVWEYIHKEFADRPDWTGAIERALLDAE